MTDRHHVVYCWFAPKAVQTFEFGVAAKKVRLHAYYFLAFALVWVPACFEQGPCT